ncbi:MAG: hypothetical protein NVSMB66_6460 [Candidatus Doudnabacteria bacterium]
MRFMPILNYTTGIQVEKSITEIQKCLVSHGANAVLSEYDNGYIVAVSFKMRMNENDIGFRLPADWKPVLTILKNNPKVPRRLCTQEQALRVAWRIVKDWVEAQMAIVETKMIKAEQVFLPYVVMKDGRTLSEHAITNPKFLLE